MWLKNNSLMQIKVHVKGVIMENLVPDGVTVNEDYYKKILRTLWKRVKRKRP